jgi:hypothetical protein
VSQGAKSSLVVTLGFMLGAIVTANALAWLAGSAA